MDMLEETKIYQSKAKKEIPIPEKPFEKFYKEFKTIAEMKKSKQWKDIYSNYYEFDESEELIDLTEDDEDIENYDTHRQMQEIIRCTNSFSYFCLKYAKINHPIFGLINFIPYSYQRRVINCYEHNRFNILSKFRQGGLTTVSVVWAAWCCLFKTGQRIMVVSKTDREAIAAGEVAKTIVEHLPSWLKPETDKFNEHEKQFKTTSSVLWFHTVEAARGKSITILIIDEAAFIKDMDKHWKSLFPTLATGGRCEVVSTVCGMGNWYEEKYHEAEAGKNKFNIIEIDYWEHPLYNDPKWIEDTRSTLGEKGWRQEIERSFLGSGDTWLNSVVLANLIQKTKDNQPLRMAFDKWKNKESERRNPWDEGALWIWQEPIPGHEYIIGADCAEGVGETGDNNSFQVIDIVTLEQVAEFYSNTIPPHMFANIISQIGYYYNTALVVVENMSQGIAVLNTLQHDLAYDNIFSEDNKQNSLGLKSTSAKRPIFLQTLQQRLLNGTLTINSSRLITEFNTFIFNPIKKRPEAQRGKHDDAIIAFAIALYVRDIQLRGLPVGSEVPDETMQFFKSATYQEIRNEIINADMEEFLNKEEDEDELTMLENDFNFFKNTVNNKKRFQRDRDALLREFGW